MRLLREGGISTNIVRELLGKLILHDLIGLVKGGLNYGEFSREVQPHVDILTALAREQEGNLAVRGGLLNKERTRAQDIDRAALLEHLERPLDLLRLGLSIRSGRRHPDRSGGVKGPARTGLETPDQSVPIQGRHSPDPFRQGLVLQCREHHSARAARHGTAARPYAWHILAQNHVEIGTAEAKCAHADQALTVGLPGLAAGLDLQRHRVHLHIGPCRLKVDRGRQDLVVQGQRGLDAARSAGCRLEVADIRLDAADADRATRPSSPRTDDLRQRIDLDLVADHRGRTMTLDQIDVCGVHRCIRKSTPKGQVLPSGVGRRDPLALAIRARADPRQERIDAVAITLRIGPALEH